MNCKATRPTRHVTTLDLKPRIGFTQKLVPPTAESEEIAPCIFVVVSCNTPSGSDRRTPHKATSQMAATVLPRAWLLPQCAGRKPRGTSARRAARGGRLVRPSIAPSIGNGVIIGEVTTSEDVHGEGGEDEEYRAMVRRSLRSISTVASRGAATSGMAAAARAAAKTKIMVLDASTVGAESEVEEAEEEEEGEEEAVEEAAEAQAKKEEEEEEEEVDAEAIGVGVAEVAEDATAEAKAEAAAKTKIMVLDASALGSWSEEEEEEEEEEEAEAEAEEASTGQEWGDSNRLVYRRPAGVTRVMVGCCRLTLSNPS